jgi:hypothetical protein
MSVADFKRDLAYSYDENDDKVLNNYYIEKFPLADYIETVRFDERPDLQRRGIDKIIHMKNGSTITVDEKKYRKNHDNVLLEVWSDNGETGCEKKLGWLYTDTCDYIVEYTPCVGKILLLPRLILQMAWSKHKHIWMKLPNAIVKLRNRGYVTVAVKQFF